MSHRDRKKRLARRQWMQAGKTCFAREGFDGTSVARIATEANLSRPGFFLYFPSKQALRTAIRLECLQALAMLANQEAGRAGRPQQRVQRALERMTHWVQQEAATVRGCELLVSGVRDDELAEQQAWERLAQQVLAAADASESLPATPWCVALLRSAWQQPSVDIQKLGALLFAVLAVAA